MTNPVRVQVNNAQFATVLVLGEPKAPVNKSINLVTRLPNLFINNLVKFLSAALAVLARVLFYMPA